MRYIAIKQIFGRLRQRENLGGIEVGREEGIENLVTDAAGRSQLAVDGNTGVKASDTRQGKPERA
jgi:hypothetical protein